MASELARKIKAERTLRGWTQENLAQHARVTGYIVRRLEQDEAVVNSHVHLGAIADAFGIPMSELLAPQVSTNGATRQDRASDDSVSTQPDQHGRNDASRDLDDAHRGEKSKGTGRGNAVERH